MGGRFNSYVDSPITLQFEFRINNNLANAHQVIKVETFSSYDNAVNNIAVIDTIAGAEVRNLAQGVYEYDIPAKNSAAVYYDKVTLIPEDGVPEISFIQAFYVLDQDYSGGAGDLPKCSVWGYFRKPTGEGELGKKIRVMFRSVGSAYQQSMFSDSVMELDVDERGRWSIDLIPTKYTDPEVMAHFEFPKAGGGYQKYDVEIPDAGTVAFADLIK